MDKHFSFVTFMVLDECNETVNYILVSYPAIGPRGATLLRPGPEGR